MIKAITTIVLFSSLILTITAFAADYSNGKELHDENCIACHDSDKYASKNRKINDLASLTSQVKRCDFSLGTQWFDEDIADVVNYLNKDFYDVE